MAQLNSLKEMRKSRTTTVSYPGSSVFGSLQVVDVVNKNNLSPRVSTGDANNSNALSSTHFAGGKS